MCVPQHADGAETGELEKRIIGGEFGRYLRRDDRSLARLHVSPILEDAKRMSQYPAEPACLPTLSSFSPNAEGSWLVKRIG